MHNPNTKRETSYNASIFLIAAHIVLLSILYSSIDPHAIGRPNCRKRTNCESASISKALVNKRSVILTKILIFDLWANHRLNSGKPEQVLSIGIRVE